MEKLELTGERELRIYCFSVRRWTNITYLHTDPVLPHAALFYLGYSLDDVQIGINEKYGNMPMEILMHGDIAFKEMVDKVNLINTFVGARPLEMENIQPGGILQAELNPEVQKTQFINNLRLVADRFVEPNDKKTLLDILNRVNFKVDNHSSLA